MDNNIISKHTDKNTPLFQLNGNTYICKIVNIVSPNIIKVVFKPYDTYIKVNIKLNNIELYNDNNLNDKAFKYLCNLLIDNYNNLDNNLIFILNNKDHIYNLNVLYFDKNGYLICDLYKNLNDNSSISDLMILSNFVKKYKNNI